MNERNRCPGMYRRLRDKAAAAVGKDRTLPQLYFSIRLYLGHIFVYNHIMGIVSVIRVQQRHHITGAIRNKEPLIHSAVP